MNGNNKNFNTFSVRHIFIAGMAGGMAEILWFVMIGLLLSLNVQDVATGITSSVIPDLSHAGYAAPMGIIIHLLLSVILAAIYLFTLGRWSVSRFKLTGQLITGATALVLVWAVNYYLILPILNPSFIEATTYSLSLLSKVLFGISMVLTFNYLKARSKGR